MMKSLLWILVLTALVVTQGRKGFGPGEQDWGHVTVREGAHMFWWLYYTTANGDYTQKPLIIWLQGGPGASSTGYGNFAELGPLDLDLKPRNYTWVKDANVLFIDNPVGTGFSYVDNVQAYTRDNRQIGMDLVQLMKVFYEKFPEFKKVPLYIATESYGGKMGVEFAYLLDKEIKASTIECNLVGVALIDSWISPIDSVLTWAPFLLQIGAVDQEGHDKIHEAALKTQTLLEQKKFSEATSQWSTTEYVISEYTHGIDFYNVLTKTSSWFRSSLKSWDKNIDSVPKPSVYESDDSKLEKIMQREVKKALDLNLSWGKQSGIVFSMLREDFMKPAEEMVELLINSTDIKVFVLTGQLDLIVDTPGTVLWVDKLAGINKGGKWGQASREAIVVNGVLEGYKKELGNFGLYWILRSGHMVPLDNPPAMDYVLRKLTDDYSGYMPR